MPQRRRPQYNIPGQKADFKVRGSRYRINREADEFFVRGGRVRSGNIGVEGSTTHIHLHTGRGRRRHARPNIDFEARRRQVEAAVKKRAKQIGAFANMPGRTLEEAALRQARLIAATGNRKIRAKTTGAMTADFKKGLHPIRAVVGLKKSSPLNFSSWYYHPVKSANNLIAAPARLRKLGLGRASKRSQVKSFGRDAEKKSAAFAAAGGEGEAINAYAEYRGKMERALAELQAGGSTGSFERKVKDAEDEMTIRLSGTGGLFQKYRSARKAA